MPAFEAVLASWSMSPLCTPTPTFSARWHSCASAIGSTGSSSTASATATSSAADDDSPAPIGTSLASTPSNPRTARPCSRRTSTTAVA